MGEVTGYGIDLEGLSAKIKEADTAFKTLKATGVATANAINSAFATAATGGIQQMKQNIEGIFGALSKDGGAKKSVEKIGDAVSAVGVQATKSATGIDALIRSITNGGDAYVFLMKRISSSTSGVKNPAIAKIDQDIHESQRKLWELKESIEQLGKGKATSEQTAEITAIKNTIDMLERKKESMIANIKLQERLAKYKDGVGIFGQNTRAKFSSDEYVRVYENTIREYESAWERVDRRLAKKKVAEYKATMNEIMSLDKSMYSTNKSGIGGTEDARVVEARHRELMQKKLALENELDELIARNRLNKEDKLAKDVENIQARSGAKTSAERQRRVAQETDAERREKIAQYKATLAEMKSLDSKLYYVNTRGTDAEKAAMAETRARFEQLSRDKERLETELGRRVSRIRNQFESEFQSEEGRRAVQTRIMKENEAKKAANEAKRIAREKAAEERRIEKENLRDYSSLMRQKFSLTGDIERLGRKVGLSDADKARLEELRRKEQELNREIASLSVQLGHKKDSIDREYQNKVLQRTAKRCVQEAEIEVRESEKTRNQVIKAYEKTVSRMASLKKQMENSSSLASSSKNPADAAAAKAAYDEQYRQYQEFDAKRQILENKFAEWLKETRARQTAQQLDEDINAIRKRQAEEKAAADAAALAKRQSYDGAMAQSKDVIANKATTEIDHKRAIEDLIAAREKLSKADGDYVKKQEAINKQIEEHKRLLKESAMTEQQKTEQAERDADRRVKAQERVNRELEKEARSAKPVSQLLSTDTTNMTLRELQNYAASIKATMANLQPRSNEWNQLNAVLQTTNGRINGIKKEMGLLRTSTKDASDAMASLGRFMNIAFVAQRLWSFTNSVVKLTGEFEQMQVALKTIVGSLEASNKLWEQTVELASKSPFKATELIKYTRQLAAYRIETSKLHDTTKMLADVSAGLGVDMSRLILAYGQVRAAEYLRGTELRQFTEAGVPMLEELAKHFTELNGKATTTAEVFEMISKRKVAFSDVSAVLEKMTSEGGPFYKMQEQLANTIKGNIATLKNEVDLMMHDIGQSSSGLINGFLKTLKFLVKNWEYVAVILKTVLGLYLGYQVATLAAAISTGKMATAIVRQTVTLHGLAGAYAKAAIAIRAFKTAMMSTPIGWIIAAVTALISVISLVVKKVSAAKKAEEERAKEVEEEMKRISEAYEGMRERVESALSVFDDAKSSSKDAEIALYDLIDIAKEEYHMTFVVDVKGKSKEQLKEESERVALGVLAAGEDAMSLEKQWEKTWSTMLIEYDNFVTKAMKTDEVIHGELHGEEWDSPVYKSFAVKKGTQEKELKDVQKIITDYYNKFKETIKKESTDAQNLAHLQMSPAEIVAEFLSGRMARVGELDEEGYEVYSAALKITEAYDSVADEIINSQYLSSDKGNAIKLFLNGLVKRGELTAEQISDLRDIIENKIGASLDIATKGLTPFQEKFNEFLAKVPDITLADIDSKTIQEMGDKYKKLLDNGERSNDFARFFDPIDAGSTATQESIAKQVKEELDGWKDIKKAYEDAMAKGMKSIYSKGEYDVALKGIEFLDPIYVYLTGGEGKDEKEKKKEAVKILNDRIDLIKKMHKQYLDEFDTFGDDAEDAVANAYKKAFKDAFEGTGISFSGLVIDSEKLAELQKAGEEAGSVFSDAMLAKMKEVEEAGTYIRSLGDSFDDVKEKLKKDEGFVGYIYSDTDKKAIKTQISTMEDLYEFFDKDGSQKKGKGTLTIGYGHALQTIDEAKKYLGITLSQASAEELLIKDIKAREGSLNVLLDKYDKLIVTQEQYNQLFNNLYQGGLPAAMKRAGDMAKTEEYIRGLDADLRAMGTSFAEQFGEDWIEQYKQLPTYAERFAKQLEIAALTTADKNSHIDPKLFEGMKKRSAGRAAAFAGDLEVVKLLDEAAVNVSQIDFTNVDGVVAALERLRPIAQKEGAEAVIALEEAIAGFEAEIGLTAKKDADKAIVDKVQKYLDEYDLVVELKKLNISPELAKNLFDVDYISLDDLKTKVVEEFAKGSKDGAEKVKTELDKNLLDVDWSVIKGELGEDQADKVKETLEKIDKLVRKQREDDAKEFAKFLKNNLDEIKIIQDKGAYNISLTDKLYGEGKITAEEYVSAIRRVVADTNSEVAKINLEKFKESSLYIKAMGNLAAYSRDELKTMADELKKQLANGAPNMGADEIKEYYDAIGNLIEQYDKLRGPFQENEIAKIAEYYKQQKELNKAKEEELTLEKQKKAIEQEITNLQSTLASQTKSGDTEGAQGTQKQITEKVGKLQEINGQLVSVSSNVTVISEKIANLGGGMVEWLMVAQGIVNEISNVANASTDIFNNVKEIFSAYGADTESGGWAKASTAMEMVGGVTGDLTSGLSALASGNIAGAISAVVGMVTKLVTGFAKIHDQKYVDEIERQTKEVERLSKAYEKLEEQTEQAFSISHLKEYNKELQNNLDDQIAAYDAMIKAEEAKKKTDQSQIDAWNDEIENLRKQKEDAEKSALESLGAVQIEEYRSQTRSFVDAWVSAFKDTGDGLSALEDNFEEFFDNIIAEQATLKITDALLKPLYDNLNEYLKDFELTSDESKSLKAQADAIMPELSAALEQIWTSLGGGNGSTSGSLSELQKGIQGVTEETAQVLEALLNSMRLYVADTNNEIRSQTEYIRKMYKFMEDSVSGFAPFYVQMHTV